ncbi:uncharacterized protein VTP21DRAFT_9496 [Calcarisporiella thermophila]|uniref:uncharacterized protein n=1 Tax=Calcarisporiella thermophila TaxID=911321 RepID=UPI0037436A3C
MEEPLIPQKQSIQLPPYTSLPALSSCANSDRLTGITQSLDQNYLSSGESRAQFHLGGEDETDDIGTVTPSDQSECSKAIIEEDAGFHELKRSESWSEMLPRSLSRVFSLLHDAFLWTADTMYEADEEVKGMLSGIVNLASPPADSIQISMVNKESGGRASEKETEQADDEQGPMIGLVYAFAETWA